MQDKFVASFVKRLRGCHHHPTMTPSRPDPVRFFFFLLSGRNVTPERAQNRLIQSDPQVSHSVHTVPSQTASCPKLLLFGRCGRHLSDSPAF